MMKYQMVVLACAAGVWAGTYEPNWESLNRHQPPEWLQDAKFGIYAHWGLYSVPAFASEWYAKYLYSDGREDVWKYHTENFGHPSEFGYKDFVPLFTAEKFDAAEWAKLIRSSGAKYAGLAVVHHDGFMLWDSRINRWNVGQMGPKRDLYGELVQALRAEEMKVTATFHLLRGYGWMTPSDDEGWERAVREGWDVADPEYADFYWSPRFRTYEEFLNEWKLKVREVVDNYQPDLLWFDGGGFRDAGVEKIVMGNLAYYLSKEAEWGRQIEVLNKLPVSGKFNFGNDFGMLNFEEGRDRGATCHRPWIDDMKISWSGWGYLHGQKYRSVNEVVDGLIDRVARNGGLLLSLCPLPDGTINQPQIDVLTGVGEFLKDNGEAIYETRPWKIHAEGDEARLQEAHGENTFWRFHKCNASDIRFTRSKDLKTLYVFTLGYPEGGRLRVKSLGTGVRVSDGGIRSVSSVKTGAPVEWTRSADGMEIVFPSGLERDGMAYAFKVEVNGLLDLN